MYQSVATRITSIVGKTSEEESGWLSLEGACERTEVLAVSDLCGLHLEAGGEGREKERQGHTMHTSNVHLEKIKKRGSIHKWKQGR